MSLPIIQAANVAKSTEVEQRPGLQSQQFADELKERTAKEAEQVVKSGKPEEGEINKDGRGGASYQRRRPGRRRANRPQAELSKSGGSMLDIKM